MHVTSGYGFAFAMESGKQKIYIKESCFIINTHTCTHDAHTYTHTHTHTPHTTHTHTPAKYYAHQKDFHHFHRDLVDDNKRVDFS